MVAAGGRCTNERDRRALVRPLANVLIAGILPSCVLACADDATLVPAALPYRLERTVTYTHAIAHPADLDLDGADEIIEIYEPSRHPSRPVFNAALIRDHTGDALGQANFPGIVVGVTALDTDADGLPEVIVHFVRSDSLFVTGIDARAHTKFSFFITSGAPRVEPEGIIAWDPSVAAVHVADVDADGSSELISVVNTGYARRPRGVFIHALPRGELVDQLVTGAPFSNVLIADFDRNGVPEIAAGTAATDNGAEAGGFDDRHSYFLVVGLNPLRVLHTVQFGGVNTGAQIAYGDFDADGVREVLRAVYFTDDRTARLELLSPDDWRILRRHVFARPVRWLATADVDRDARPEILITQPPDTLLLLNGDLDVIRRKQLPGVSVVEVVDDLDGDAIPEILALSESHLWLLAPDLSVRATADADPNYRRLANAAWTSVMRRNANVRELMVKPGSQHVTYRLKSNPLWPYHRWGRQAIVIVTVLALLAAAIALAGLRRRVRRLTALNAVALDDDSDGLFRIGVDGRINWSNRTLQHWLAYMQNGGPGDLEAVRSSAPELADFCRRAISAVPPRHEQSTGPLPGSPARHARYSAEPLEPARGSAGDWLVRVRDETERHELQEARTWTLLAQRVAHDVKNPLTSLLLTLQRLMMEYQARAPELAPDLDRYTGRMTERIEQLRRMTANFMKFVEADAPEVSDLDLNQLVTAVADRISRGLAPDIRLVLRLSPVTPFVCVDPQQIESVLENLAANAVNAMPDGGTITMATSVQHGIRLSGLRDVENWAELEVLDTGFGIPAERLELIFEPGYTQTKHGSGLGLTIVRRIVERHGGRISVESEPGTGSVFSIYLPLVQALDARRHAATGAASASPAATTEP